MPARAAWGHAASRRPHCSVFQLGQVLSFLLEWPATVEASTGLELANNWTHSLQVGALVAEKEFIKVGLFCQSISIVPPDVMRPGSFDQINDELIVLAETKTDAGFEGNVSVPSAAVIQKIELLRVHGLQFPEWQLADLGSNLRH
jgi:hypothetical protein